MKMGHPLLKYNTTLLTSESLEVTTIFFSSLIKDELSAMCMWFCRATQVSMSVSFIETSVNFKNPHTPLGFWQPG